MRTPRLIGRMDIKNKNLIKPINLEGLRVVGNPNDHAIRYYKEGIDEILFMDTVASLYGRNHLSDIIHAITKDIFIPITVGGGIRDINDVKSILDSGADKVAINTAAVQNPQIIKKISDFIGSQSLVISIEAKKRSQKKWEVYTSNGRDRTGIDVIEWIRKVENFRAGEILLTSIDKEGTGQGFDCELAKEAYDNTNLPIIISGGLGSKAHITELKSFTNFDAIAVADVIHYNKIPIMNLKDQLK